MKKVSELDGAELDYWVAMAGDMPVRWEFDDEIDGTRGRLFYDFDNKEYRFKEYAPSRDWSQGGPIIEREGIDVTTVFIEKDKKFIARKWDKPNGISGNSYLVAAMRTYVASKFGEEIETE